jgi:redox-regulated HSP33 family molecular chaperone
LIEHREYPAAIRDTLGEAVAASLLLAATIKFDGVLSLQLQGDGPVHLMLAQCTSGLAVRGLARYREGIDTGAGAPAGSGNERIVDLVGAGNLTVTLETDDGSQRYQGIVPIAGRRLAESLQVYFENSEQLPTRLWLHADAHGASGMLLQKLPAANAASGAGAMDVAAIDDAWRRVQLIGDTLTPKELGTLADAEILHRLFNEDDVRATGSVACCRGWAKRRPAPFWPNAGKSKCVATSAIVPMYSMRWMWRNCSMRGLRAAAVARCTEGPPNPAFLSNSGTAQVAWCIGNAEDTYGRLRPPPGFVLLRSVCAARRPRIRRSTPIPSTRFPGRRQ